MSGQGDFSDNELDAFDAGREKVLFEDAGHYLNNGGDSDEEQSDEEVMGLKYQDNEESDGDSDGEEDDEEDNENKNSDDEKGWGSKKDYYGGDDISDDEDANEMAEEALRQQKKHVQDLEMDDFVDEEMLESWTKAAQDYDSTETKLMGPVVNEEAVDFESFNEDEKLKFLAGYFPEFVPLVKEFNVLAPKLADFKTVLSSPTVETKIVALTAYLSSITSYFAIFVENLKLQGHFSMKESPVMESILSSREVWRQANDLNTDISEIEDIASMEEDAVEENVGDMDEAEESKDRMQTDSEEEEEQEESDLDEDRKVNIDTSIKRSIKKSSRKSPGGDFAETYTPESVDKEEKERRRKTLRFYTSKIDQAANKLANHERFTGDSDLPYKERLFERQQRLVEEARKKGLGLDKQQLGDYLDTNEYTSSDEKTAQEINDNAEDYYESIKQGKRDKKEARRVAHEEAKRASRDGSLAELREHVGEDGKRALNFQILKNKGLTPNRRNDNRNARVKKRKRYEQAQKKLKSVRRVYDDKNRGPYLGEKTGIKKGLSRSVKLV